MTLKLHSHPLSSYSHKALIALYENGTPFEPVRIDLGDAASRAAFEAVWPMMKMPVLQDEARGQTVAEATVVIEYLDTHYPGATRFLPADPDAAWQVRMWDRFWDNYVQTPMQAIVGDGLRPDGQRDPLGAEQARQLLDRAYRVAEDAMAGRTWAVGDAFSLADCAASPALFYADTVQPLGADRPALAAYLDRLTARPAYARALAEAEPYFDMFPLDPKPRIERDTAAS